MVKIRYGLVGFGGIAENRIAKEGFACDRRRFSPLRNAVLVGVTDVNPARRAAAEALGLKWYDSLENMLADESLHAIYVATNNMTHAKIATAALKSGRHVIVEKPMATCVKDAEKVNRLAKRLKLSLSVDHMMVYNAWNQEAKKLVADGVLGKVNDSCFHMQFAYGYDPAEAATWRCSKVEELGGPIGDVASHCFYVAEEVFQEPIVKLAASYYPKTMQIAAEDGAYIKFFLASGRQGSVNVAFSELRGGFGGTMCCQGFEIYGDKAVLRSYGTLFQHSGHADEPFKIRLELDTFTGKPAEPVGPRTFKNIYQTLIENHAKSILAGKPLDATNGVHNLKLCEAAHRSASNGGSLETI